MNCTGRLNSQGAGHAPRIGREQLLGFGRDWPCNMRAHGGKPQALHRATRSQLNVRDSQRLFFT